MTADAMHWTRLTPTKRCFERTWIGSRVVVRGDGCRGSARTPKADSGGTTHLEARQVVKEKQADSLAIQARNTVRESNANEDHAGLGKWGGGVTN